MKPKNFSLLAAFICLSFFLISIRTNAQKQTLGTLTQNQQVDGFKVVSVYLNDANNPMGARFIHEKTGFTLDLLQIESVPQVFFWVNTFPVSDRGEPHTQEHLLITKGNKGHNINTREGMTLTGSNAFTNQLYTAYDFYTGGGRDIFYSLFEEYLDALLYPDYTNEEVSREVRNWGVSQNPDKTLQIEEKGAVYNEMSTTMNNPDALMYDTIGRLLYGNGHPLSFNSGGLPSGIRELNADEILKFHNDNYYLGNMGAIVSLPKSEKLNNVLSRMDQMLNKLNIGSKNVKHVPKILPAPQPAQKGKIALIDFPSENAKQPGSMLLAFPATLQLSATEDVLLSNFLSVFAGDASTNLYKIFVNSKTREKGFDAQSVYHYVDNNEGQPIFVGLVGIKPENLTKEKAAFARQRVSDELNKIANYKDNSPELLAFNKRFENNLLSSARSYAKFVNSPPKFGFRNTGGEWYDQIKELNKTNRFKKSVTLKPEFDEVRGLLSSGKNIWKTYLQKWNLTTATPYVVITKADPALIAKADEERKARTEKEIVHLEDIYHLTDAQQAIGRYKEQYDSNTAVLEKSEQAYHVKFLNNPPLTLDDQLNYQQQKLQGKVPLLASVFNNMSGATTGIAINLHGVAPDKLVYLAMFPELLSQTGIIKNGKAVSYEDMSQLIQQQILSLASYYSANGTTGRTELVVRGAGNNASEAQRAVEWINDVLKYPNWQKENLPRIRDLVDQQLARIRKTMQGAEESWVSDPGRAYQFQNEPLYLATSSFLTREYNIFRLKWMLKDAHNSEAINKFLSYLAEAETGRESLKKLLQVITSDLTVNPDSAGVNKEYAIDFNNLSTSDKAIAKEAGLDLQQMLNEIPDTSLTMDWKNLCATIQKDLDQTPEKTLEDLNQLRHELLKTSKVRFFTIGSESMQQKLHTGIEKLLAGFDDGPVLKQNYSSENLIDQRVKERMHTDTTPVFVGLINPDSPTGVFINSAPLSGYKDTAENELAKFLAAELYAGGGKQSVYTKSTGAGLSYSTGVGVNPASGRFSYYAERTPLLPQSLHFIIDEIKKSPEDSSLLDYVVSLAVGGFRSASDYEIRGEAMANDLVDGITPDVVKAFRLAILRLRKQPGLIDQVYKYKDEVYEKILPGYGISSKDVTGGNFFVIGPEKQMQPYEAYLKSVDGNDTKLYRLYPRDFWMVKP